MKRLYVFSLVLLSSVFLAACSTGAPKTIQTPAAETKEPISTPPSTNSPAHDDSGQPTHGHDETTPTHDDSNLPPHRD